MSEQPPQKPRPDRRTREVGMFGDELMEQRQDATFDWVNDKIQNLELRTEIIRLVKKYHGGKGGTWHKVFNGSYNVVFVVKFKEPGSYGMMRVPLPRFSLELREEKVQAEVNLMRYVAANTMIPVPHIYHVGTALQNPTGLGPFIIMDYHDGMVKLSDLLKEPIDTQDHGVIDPAMTEDKMINLYGQMANILLQLDQLTMPQSGSLGYVDAEFTVNTRAIPQTITDVITMAGCPESILGPSNRVLNSSHEVYQYFSDLHMAQLIFQRNDAVDSEDDARDKYMARHMFRRAAYMNLLPSPSYTGRQDHITPTPETFKLICDDLAPHNVLVDPGTGNVVAVIDWEWAWFGPKSMASDPPWWLMLKKPEYWNDRAKGGIDNWMEKYPKYLDIFLKALELEEQKLLTGKVTSVSFLGEDGDGKTAAQDSPVAEWLDKLQLSEETPTTGGAQQGPKEQPLSTRMRRNWENGSFWINHATRRTYGFDPVYWKFIDERLFGENPEGGYDKRAESMTSEAREMMEMVVRDKMEEKNGERKVVEWFTEEARAHLARVLGYGQL
ncbi:hypothetical protein QBC36DRAFT_101976 [Triangularia setosa]|uniref:Aminoglycoside phosphotransferase domain-containing protein n=1 Tax=Triangularia setosa TaxID=2587417 RepID=A0AAN7A3N1_9PEZI|nr:hypothetical protein QBC36DRAFT_101976 [Podospora setosa]